MYRDGQDLITKGVNLENLLQIHNIINIGEAVYQDILNMQSSILNSRYCSTDLPRLRRAIIYTQFEKEFLTQDFPFKCKALKVNNFGLRIPELSDENIIYHIARTKEKGILPEPSNYRIKKATLNNFVGKQYILDGVFEPKQIEEKYYALITYGGDEKIDFINLVIPDKNFQEVVGIKDLTNMNKLFENTNIQTNEAMTQRRMKLKEEVLKKIQVQGV